MESLQFLGTSLSAVYHHMVMVPAPLFKRPGPQLPGNRTTTASVIRAAAALQHGAQSIPLPGPLDGDYVDGVVVDEVPIVDLAELRSSSGRAQGTQRVAAACRDWGFFQVVNHGVSIEFVHKLRKQCLDVFSLPQEQKDKVSRRSQGSQWVYDYRPNHGPLEVLQLNPWDSPQLHTCAHALNCSEDFIAVYEEANLVFRTLAMEILDILIEGLRVDAKHFQAHKKESQGVLRANYYHQSKAADQVLGLIPHVDGNLFTILHQQDVSGLEVLKDGSWIPITPRNDAFCINVADIMQVLTNDEYTSVQHRAVGPKTQARLSLAYFLTPAAGVTLVAAPELVNSLHPPRYRPFTWKDFVDASKGADRPYPSVLPFFEQRH
ncbi:hypothetical protein KC19_5G023100 [Ceratodon purpureus]|uniref:Fe2OG dioxygenase domain-containing protein n=1 Tax=Ceratodon purpureus TaxID=3225 RepID=A0A8T0HX34_CERPU|nr:hypothetical protein KC19_5G023100 [Ceratodon purpureus]